MFDLPSLLLIGRGENETESGAQSEREREGEQERGRREWGEIVMGESGMSERGE